MEQARVAMCRAFDIPFKESLDTMVPTGIYTLPEVSMVGLTEEAARARAMMSRPVARTSAATPARASQIPPRVSSSWYSGGRTATPRRGHPGRGATELIHIAQALLHRDGAIDEFIDTTFNFPTRADAYKYAAYDGLPPAPQRWPSTGPGGTDGSE